MKLYRILISAPTASFRYPNVMVNYQLSLKAIPYTTVLGMIASAIGRHDLSGFHFSYTFRYETLYTDIETIYKIKRDEKKSGVDIGFDYKAGTQHYLRQKAHFPNADAFRREVLYGCYLTLYVDSETIAKAFRCPMYQLLMGRSGDLAKVHSVQEIDVTKSNDVALQGTLVENPSFTIPGELLLLPKRFSYKSTIRQPVDTQPFALMDGRGHFKLHPDYIEEDGVDVAYEKLLRKFDLRNWEFQRKEVVLKLNGFIDKELETSILLRHV